jgi:hypothetical protein
MATFIETLMGKEDKLDNQSEYTLSLNNNSEEGESKTVSIGKVDIERTSKSELESAYRIDSFVFNAVNVSKEMIMSAGYKIVAKKATVRKFFENFFENISRVGADSTFDEILERIYQDAYIYGGAWDEIVWNVEDTKPVDLKTLNPAEMDFARDEKGNVILDENEKVIGYTQTLPYGIDLKEKGDEVPEGVSLKENQIFILPKRISYIPLYTFGSGFDGMGRVESAYKATIWKLNLLKAGAESTSRRGFSPIIAKVGNDNVHPTPQMTANILEKLKTLDYSKYMAIPNYVELTTLDVKSIDTYDGFLKYLTAMQSAALGVPVPFVTGLGEETNRATLGTQLQVYELSLNNIAQKICRHIEKNIFKPIAIAEGFDEVPRLEWGTISTLPEKLKNQLEQTNVSDVEKNKEEYDEKDPEDILKDKGLDLNTSSQNRGAPLNTSHQIQGVIQKKKKRKM